MRVVAHPRRERQIGDHRSAMFDRLHALTRLVETLGVCGRIDPEAIFVAKHGIVGELRAPAREVGP